MLFDHEYVYKILSSGFFLFLQSQVMPSLLLPNAFFNIFFEHPQPCTSLNVMDIHINQNEKLLFSMLHFPHRDTNDSESNYSHHAIYLISFD